MRTNVLALFACSLAIAWAPGSLAQAEQIWPGFRGLGGKGIAVEAKPPLTWNAKEGKNILWKTTIERHGMSSPIVSGDRLFITAADYDVRQVLCYDSNTGKRLWTHGVDSVPEQNLPRVLEETGYAAPTPVTNGKLVAAVFGTGELVCVNVKGDRVWFKELDVPVNHYGHASSLIWHEELLIVQYDQKEKPRVLAFEFATGKPLWEVKRGAMSWSSPILVDNNGRAEVILTSSKTVESYDPRSGKPLWRVDCLDGEVASSAAYADGIVFVASEGATAAAIDISNHDKDPKILWRWDESLPDAASLVAAKDCLVVPTAYGVVTCLDTKAGTVHWEHEFKKGFNSSPILVGDRVYLTDLSGTTQIFRMAKKFESLGTAQLGEDVYATPAFVGDRIFLRGLRHLFCVSAKP